MRRRQFFKAVFTLPATLLVKPPRAQQVDQDNLVVYGDSEGSSQRRLAQLHDGNTRTGGIEYQA